MTPLSCAHCGFNFMMHTTNSQAPHLCNNCLIREQARNPKKEVKMATVDILIKCPQEVYADIEEHCINNAVDISTYFLNLHNDKKVSDNEELENQSKHTFKGKKR